MDIFSHIASRRNRHTIVAVLEVKKEILTWMLASWIFGTLLLVFILGVFVFAPSSLPPFKQRLLAFICALLAGFFAFFFTGTIGVTWRGVQATGGIGAFVLVLWWWSSGLAPVKVSQTTEPPDSGPPEFEGPRNRNSKRM